MFYLLNPRVIIALALVGALAFSHFMAYRKGAANVRTEWQAATSRANQEARALEQARQSAVGAAQRIAATAENRLRADAGRAADSDRGLRDDLDAARHLAEESRAAAVEVVRVSTGLLEQCTREYLSMAENAQRADIEARELRQSWPK